MLLFLFIVFLQLENELDSALKNHDESRRKLTVYIFYKYILLLLDQNSTTRKRKWRINS